MIAECDGGLVVREAKAYVPSAWTWAHAKKVSPLSVVHRLGVWVVQVAGPSPACKAGFVIRRVAPDARKIQLVDVQGQSRSAQFLTAMGADLAAVHAADPRSSKVLEDLKTRAGTWLLRAVQAAKRHTEDDFAAYAASAA